MGDTITPILDLESAATAVTINIDWEHLISVRIDHVWNIITNRIDEHAVPAQDIPLLLFVLPHQFSSTQEDMKCPTRPSKGEEKQRMERTPEWAVHVNRFLLRHWLADQSLHMGIIIMKTMLIPKLFRFCSMVALDQLAPSLTGLASPSPSSFLLFE